MNKNQCWIFSSMHRILFLLYVVLMCFYLFSKIIGLKQICLTWGGGGGVNDWQQCTQYLTLKKKLRPWSPIKTFYLYFYFPLSQFWLSVYMHFAYGFIKKSEITFKFIIFQSNKYKKTRIPPNGEKRIRMFYDESKKECLNKCNCLS